MKNLTKEEQDRLWQHGLHEDQLFNERLNSFVGFQSILLVMASALLLSEPERAQMLARIVAVIGIITGMLSAYFQKRQADYVELIGGRCRELFPEFLETHRLRQESSPRLVSSQRFYAILLPVLFIVVWVVLLLI